jgi:dTDP-4-amino-4,6-dideoxygalactose transaminase
MGDAGTFSFFPSKNLGGFGDGGLVATNRDDLADRVRLLRTHGARPKYFHKAVGGNFRLDALQCALLRVKLPHLTSYRKARRANAVFYAEKLAPIADASRLVLPSARPECDHIWNQYTLRVPGPGRRDALKQHLTQVGIGSEIYYPVPMHRQECFAHLPTCSLPVAERFAGEAITIPVFPELTEAERRAVVAAVTSFFTQAR